MKIRKKQPLWLSALALAFPFCCYGQQEMTKSRTSENDDRFNIKTNLLYDATATFNLGAELRLNNKTSLDLSGNWNPWTFSNNQKWKHILVQPEVRWWTRETFRGHFFGLHGHYSYYNVGNLPKPPFSQNMKDHRYEGWLAGAGLGYGYRLNLNHRWGVEAEIGVGYAYMDYDKYTCKTCGEKLSDGTRHYLGPTKAAVSLVYRFNSKRKSAPLPVNTTTNTETKQVAPEVQATAPTAPKYSVTYITPETETVKIRTEEGKAYLDFAQGDYTIVSSFGNNGAELRKIHELIGKLENDPDATITGVTITGYASPEGSWMSNLMLSEKRAYALKEHLRSVYGFPARLFSVEGRGEDWNTLAGLVAESFLPDKYQVLEIIRGADIFDGREKKLMELSGGRPYRELQTNFFPLLRRSDYSLHYTVAPFTTEKGKTVFKSNPARLSLNELFLIANTYEPGSDAFNEVFETAVLIYPDNDDALVNSAASALERGDAGSAAHYLGRVRSLSSEYYNNTGIFHILRGEYDQAAEAFERALSLGNEKVARNLKLLTGYRKEVENYEQRKRGLNKQVKP